MNRVRIKNIVRGKSEFIKEKHLKRHYLTNQEKTLKVIKNYIDYFSFLKKEKNGKDVKGKK